MAYVSAIACLAILLVLQPMIVRSDVLAPLLSPIMDNVCKEVKCGKGTCKPSQNTTFFYECECERGWRRTTSGQDDNLKFLPCVIPNCTLDFSCAQAPSPVQNKAGKANASIFDPCYWIDCGGGSCNTTSNFTYSCQCAEDYYNLLNISTFPCFKECAIGMDCKDLGIIMSNKSGSPPALADNSNNQASQVLLQNFHWLMLLMISLAMIQWK